MRTPKFRNRLTGFEPLEDRQLLSVTTILNDFNNATIHDIHTVTGSNTQGGLQYESSAAKPGARVALITDAEFRASEADPLTLSATVVIPSDDSVYLLVRADGTTAANGYHSQNEVQLYVSTSSIDIIESQNGNKVTLASLPVSLPANVPLCIEAHDNGTTVTISIPDHNVTLSATPTGTYPHAYAGLRTWAGHSRIDDFFLQYGKEEEEQQPQQSQQQEEVEEEEKQSSPFTGTMYEFTNGMDEGLQIVSGSNTPKPIAFSAGNATMGARTALFTTEEVQGSETQSLHVTADVIFPKHDSLYLLVRADATTDANGYHSKNELQVQISDTTIEIIESQNGEKTTIASKPICLPFNQSIAINLLDTGAAITVTVTTPTDTYTLSAAPKGTYPNNHVGMRNWDGPTIVERMGISQETVTLPSMERLSMPVSNVSVLSTQGPNIVVLAQPPAVGTSTVRIREGSYLGTKILATNNWQVVPLTLNTDAKTGNYTIDLVDAQNQLLDSILFHWDASSKTIQQFSETGWNASVFFQSQTAHDQALAQVDDLVSRISNVLDEEVMALEVEEMVGQQSFDMKPYTESLNEWNLRQAYQDQLLASSSFYVGRDTYVFAEMAKRPDLFPPDFAAYIDQLQLQYPGTSRAQLEYTARNQIEADKAELHKQYDRTMNTIKDVLIQAENVVIKLRTGTYTRADIEAFRNTTDYNSTILNGHNHEQILQEVSTISGSLSFTAFRDHLQSAQQHVDNKATEMLRRHEAAIVARAFDDSTKLQMQYETALLEGKSVSVADGLKNMQIIANKTKTTVQLARAQHAADIAALPEMQRLTAKIERAISDSNDPRAIAIRNANKAVEVAQNTILQTFETAQANTSTDAIVQGVKVVEKIDAEFDAHNASIDAKRPTVIYNLGSITTDIPKVGTEIVDLQQTGMAKLFFTIPNGDERMVNFWVEGIAMRDVTLLITGDTLQKSYSTPHQGASGESISLHLTPGTYTVLVKDDTPYNGGTMATGGYSIPVHYELLEYNTAKIVGRMSVENKQAALPVSMSVAEFRPDEHGVLKRVADYDSSHKEGGVSKLDPTKPVWVVVHGMNSDERGGVEAVARELSFQSGISGQVVTVNWEDAANSITTRDAPWSKSVGNWVAAQLIAVGFSPEQINVVGHSHGTYVSYAIATKAMELRQSQISTIVALDPAGNIPLLSGFNDNVIDFASVSRNSLAIEGSWMAGQDSLASTVDVALKIDSSTTFDIQVLTEHSLPVSTFANLLRSERLIPGMAPKNLCLSELMRPVEQQSMTVEKDVEANRYEGAIFVYTRNSTDAYGKEYTEAVPTAVTETLPGYSQPKRWDILNPNQEIHGQ